MANLFRGLMPAGFRIIFVLNINIEPAHELIELIVVLLSVVSDCLTKPAHLINMISH
jgi:hypothetical protein